MQPLLVVTAALLGLVVGIGPADDEQELKFADCPAAVRKTFHGRGEGGEDRDRHQGEG